MDTTYVPLMAADAWEKDTNRCSQCERTLGMGTFRRRHHCRSCGKCVCLKCSPHQLPVRGLPGMQRVCIACKSIAIECPPAIAGGISYTQLPCGHSMMSVYVDHWANGNSKAFPCPLCGEAPIAEVQNVTASKRLSRKQPSQCNASTVENEDVPANVSSSSKASISDDVQPFRSSPSKSVDQSLKKHQGRSSAGYLDGLAVFNHWISPSATPVATLVDKMSSSSGSPLVEPASKSSTISLGAQSAQPTKLDAVPASAWLGPLDGWSLLNHWMS